MKIFGPGMMTGVNRGLADRERYQQQEAAQQRADQLMQMQQQTADTQQAQAARQQALYDQQMKERDAARAFMGLAMSQGVNPTIQGLMSYNKNPGPRVGVNPAYQQMQGLSPEFMAKVYTGGLQTPQEAAQAGINTYRTKKTIDQQLDPFHNLSGTAKNLATMTGHMPTPQELAVQKKAGATTVNVGAGPKAFEKEFGSLNATRFDALSEELQNAQLNIQNANTIRNIIGSGLETGKLAPLKANIAAYAEGFGINPSSLGLDSASSAQAFQAVVMKNLLVELAKQKGPQTEGDAARALKTFVQLGNTPAANEFIADYVEALARRTKEKVEYFTLNREINGGDYAKTYLNYLKSIKNKPLFATSKATGLPVTYYDYVDQYKAQRGDAPQDVIDKAWVAFVKDSKK